MSNGARHGLGVAIGVIVTPALAASLFEGTARMTKAAQTFTFQGSERWVGAGLLVVAAVLIGVIAGTRVSPLASLVPGLGFTVVGGLWVTSPRWAFQHAGRDILPDKMGFGYFVLAPYGLVLLIGVALLMASFSPARWQARTASTRSSAPT